MIRRLAYLAPFTLSLACAPAAPTPTAPAIASSPPPIPANSFAEPAPESAPTLRLPSDARPTAERLELHIDPSKDRFSGAVDIAVTLTQTRAVLWLHGLDLHVTHATVTPANGAPIEAVWEQKDPTGIASLSFRPALPAGAVTIHIEYDAAFGTKLEGLYKSIQSGVPYAFTQFESISAREAFPCFDEPAIKIPFDTTLVVPTGLKAIANTHELDRKTEGANDRIHFAITRPLPSYLIAFAVGDLDVVNAPDVPPNSVRSHPLPLRGVTAKGRGKEIAYSIAHTGEFVTLLENYFGLEYPYDKLDILAVPDKQGAMENAGAVMFAEYLLLFDEKTAPTNQKNGYARVMAHELAHQWVGDLVTAAWWDDIWLNEAFATWIEAKITDQWDPKTHSSLDLLGGVQGALGNDSLVSARAIRQPIVSNDDIENAFDSITYEKGGGVLAMFERWIGADVFQKGVHEHLAAHAFGAATADDFLQAMSKAAGKDVKSPFRTFLDQPGSPLLEAEVRCDGKARMHMKQSRYFPLASTGDANKTWQMPVCAKYQVGKETKEACTLLTEKEGDLALGDQCPSWVFPNADAAGYLRFTLAKEDLAKLRSSGFSHLSTRERVAYGNSLRVAFNRQTMEVRDIFQASAPMANDPHPEVAREAMSFVGTAHSWLFETPLRKSVEAYARKLFGPVMKQLGWDRKPSDDDDRAALRSQVIGFLAFNGHDETVRNEAKRRAKLYLGIGADNALHPEALDKDLAGIVLAIAGEDEDKAMFDAMHALLLKTEDERIRGQLIGAMSSGRSPAMGETIRAFPFDPALRVTEVTRPIWRQLDGEETREATWQWLKTHFDEFQTRVSAHHGKTQLIDMGGDFCDAAHGKDVEAFYTPRAPSIEGGPRVLASVLEDIRLCAAKRSALESGVNAFFKSP